MSIYRIEPDDVESFTVVTNPLRQYTSSSTQGVTGSVYVFPRRSSLQKDVDPSPAFVDAAHTDDDISSALQAVQQTGKLARLATNNQLSSSFPGMISGYLDRVNALGASSRQSRVIDVKRSVPSVDFSVETVKKQVIKDNLSAYHRTTYPSAHWAYVNYHALNFFTSSTVPTSSVLLYPNVSGGPTHDGFVTGTFVPSGAFSFDFYINPRYQPDQCDGAFKAGTIIHLSSTYALSLVSGTRKDENGRPATYRLQLQLSHSADVRPSLAVPGTFPNDLIFLSDDALKFNTWHHVVVRWGTDLVEQGTGSFNVDGVDRGRFVVPSGTIAPKTYVEAQGTPDVMCVGNFYEGTNRGTSRQSLFFATDPATRDGLAVLTGAVGVNEPLSYSFNHPLNAELHDVALKRYYMSDVDLAASASAGPKSIDSDWVAFYLPPFYVTESPFRQYVGTHGGVPQTPFFEIDGTTSHPFNVAMAFGVAGHYVNLENYVRDFASNVFPRLHHMTASILQGTTTAKVANDWLYEQPHVRRRNTLIVPCDDGLFVPSFELLASESSRAQFVDDLGHEDLSFVNLSSMLSTASLLFGSDFGGGDRSSTQANFLANESIGFTPEQPGLAPGRAFLGYVSNVDQAIASGTFDAGVQDGAPLAIYQRTRDPSSNQVTVFDVSNLFYGTRILPKSLTLVERSLSGSGGRVAVTLKDDGRGGIYRADCLSSQSTWNCVGTVYYDEGIIVIKNPHLYFFGADSYELTLKGEQNVHVMKVDVTAPANQLNSSSNPNFISVRPSPFANDPDKEFVYISGINLHDDNYNVVMKAQLAQPIMKRHGDRINFKIRYDF